MKLKNILIPKGNVYFMSDLHYNHANVLKFDSRPFENIEEMNQYILEELKTKLKPDDIVFDLGDLFWNMRIKDMTDWIDQLPTKEIYKLVGNHDKHNLYYGDQNFIGRRFKAVTDILELKIQYGEELYRFCLSHFPFIEWPGQYHGCISLHGHVHGGLDEFNTNSKVLRLDVGFPSLVAKEAGSFLIPLDLIIEKIKQKTGGVGFEKYALEQYKCGETI